MARFLVSSTSCNGYMCNRRQGSLLHAHVRVRLHRALPFSPAQYRQADASVASQPSKTDHNGSLPSIGLLKSCAAAELSSYWRTELQPACLKAWEALGQSAEPDWAYISMLDALLGTLQTVSSTAAYVRASGNDSPLFASGQAVFAEVKNLQQEICSDPSIHAAIAWACAQSGAAEAQGRELEIEQARAGVLSQAEGASDAAPRISIPDSSAGSPGAGSFCSSSCGPTTGEHQRSLRLRHRVQLSAQLLKHVGMESQLPMAAPGKTSLTLVEQSLIISGLLAQERELSFRVKQLLYDPLLSPKVDIDIDSWRLLVEPLAAANCRSWSKAPEESQLQEEDLEPRAQQQQEQQQHSQQQAASEASADSCGPWGPPPSSGQLQLSLFPLVAAALGAHPDPQVRQQVYQAGLLTRLDAVLGEWQELGETRRRIARIHGYPSYASWCLRHSLLQQPEAVDRFLVQLAEVLAPAAQQQMAVLGLSAEAEGWEVEHALAQLRAQRLSQAEKAELGPYLHLPVVMEGISTLLSELLGVQLVLQQGRGQKGGQQAHNPQEAAAAAKAVPAAGSMAGHSACAAEVVFDGSQAGGQSGSCQGATEYWIYNCATDGVAGERSCCTNSSSGGSSSSSGHSSAHSSGGSAAPLGRIVVDTRSAQGTTRLLVPGPSCMVLGGSALGASEGPTTMAQVEPAAAEAGGGAQALPHPAAGSQAAAAAGADCSGVEAEGVELRSISCTRLGPPSVVISLQSQGCLTGPNLGLGLWELCHELGHGLHMCLSAYDSSYHHLQATWMPLELLELPSTLVEGLVLNPECLRVICRHRDTGQQLPLGLARKLAAYIRDTCYNPVAYQQLVLLALVDQGVAQWSSRPTHHQVHQAWQAITQQLSVVPGTSCSLQQVLALPRMVSAKAQGYGYLYSWYVSILIWRILAPGGPALTGGKYKQAEGSGDVLYFQKHDGARLFNPIAAKVLREELFNKGAGTSPRDLLENLFAAFGSRRLPLPQGAELILSGQLHGPLDRVALGEWFAC